MMMMIFIQDTLNHLICIGMTDDYHDDYDDNIESISLMATTIPMMIMMMIFRKL